MSARIIFYTRSGCHLCAEARIVVERVCGELEVSYDEIDITSDPDLVRQFSDQVPVTFVDGSQHDFWRVDEDRLRAALS